MLTVILWPGLAIALIYAIEIAYRKSGLSKMKPIESKKTPRHTVAGPYEQQVWSRPELVELNSATDDIAFSIYGPNADSITRPTS